MKEINQLRPDSYISKLTLIGICSIVPAIRAIYVGSKQNLCFVYNKLFDSIKFAISILGNINRKTHYEHDKIYLHIFPRKVTKGTFNVSPYAVKTEMWFRLHNIRYEIVETFVRSKSTCQIPYVIYGGEEITDSWLIIDRFSRERHLDETEGLSLEQQATVIAMNAMLDNLFTWTYALHRYVFDGDEHINRYFQEESWRLPAFFIRERIKALIKSKASANGLGRKSKAEINQIGYSILRALSQYLWEKEFMMGDRITKVDCAVFSHLSQVIYVKTPLPHKAYIVENCANLVPYMERLKQALWPELKDLFPNM